MSLENCEILNNKIIIYNKTGAAQTTQFLSSYVYRLAAPYLPSLMSLNGPVCDLQSFSINTFYHLKVSWSLKGL